jgi:hypothetical protein
MRLDGALGHRRDIRVVESHATFSTGSPLIQHRHRATTMETLLARTVHNDAHKAVEGVVGEAVAAFDFDGFEQREATLTVSCGHGETKGDMGEKNERWKDEGEFVVCEKIFYHIRHFHVTRIPTGQGFSFVLELPPTRMMSPG